MRTLVSKKFLNDFPSIFDDLRTDFFLKPTHLGRSLPAVNIKETDNEFHLELAMPGLKKDHFSIEVENGVITISSEFNEEKSDKNEEGTYTRREFSHQSFSRSFTLPDSIDEENIGASYIDGVLHVSLPKREEAKPKSTKQIEIK